MQNCKTIESLEEDIERLQDYGEDQDCCEHYQEEVERLKAEIETLGSTDTGMLKEKLADYQKNLFDLCNLDETSPKVKFQSEAVTEEASVGKREELLRTIRSFD